MSAVLQLINTLKGKWGSVIRSSPTPGAEAKDILGGTECKRIINDVIEPMIRDLASGRSPGHVILVGERGNGKTHWCRYIEGLAEKYGVKAIYVSARSDLVEQGSSLVGYLVSRGLSLEKGGEPAVVLVDEIDEAVLLDAGRLREALKSDLRKLVDVADEKPLMLVLALITIPDFSRVFDEPTYSKLFGRADVKVEVPSGPQAYSIYRRAGVIWLDKLWSLETDPKRRVEFLVDTAKEYINYELTRMGQGVVGVNVVRGLLEDAVWEVIARSSSTVSGALRILKMVFGLIDETGSPVDLKTVESKAGFIRTLELVAELDKHKRSYSAYPVRSRMERFAKNLAIAIAVLKNGKYTLDVKIPPSARSGWVKAEAFVLLGNESIAFIVPQFDKALYIANKKRFCERVAKLVEGGHVNRVIVLVPKLAEKSARSLIADQSLGKWISEGRVGIVAVDEDKFFALISDLRAVKWHEDAEVTHMVKVEVNSLKDLWNRPLFSI